MRAVQVLEHIRDNGWNRFLNDVVFFDRKAILIEKDLKKASFAKDVFDKNNIEFIDITKCDLKTGRYRFALKNRYFKAMHYLDKGYGGHGIATDGMIVGDIWFYPESPEGGLNGHNDLRWLGLTLNKGEVYSFDTYLVSNFRGKNLSAAMDRSSMFRLLEKGFDRAFAYYWADNKPAVWNNRVVYKCKELKTVFVTRLFIFNKSDRMIVAANRPESTDLGGTAK